MREETLTQERLKELLHYDPETGVFTWRVRRGGSAVQGRTAGTVDANGYVCTRIDGKTKKMHRLVWLYVHGYMPELIDHVNGARHDNRLCNLREASTRVNARNKRHPQGSNPYLGVYRKRGRWGAKICANGVQRHLGYHDTPEAAHEAYVQAKRKHHAFNTL